MSVSFLWNADDRSRCKLGGLGPGGQRRAQSCRDRISAFTYSGGRLSAQCRNTAGKETDDSNRLHLVRLVGRYIEKKGYWIWIREEQKETG